MTQVLQDIVHSPAYVVWMVYLGTYPVVSALAWIAGSLTFAEHRERHRDGSFYALDDKPLVSILVAAHNEEAVIGETLERLLQLDWPAYEIVVVDDGSTDSTHAVLAPYAHAGRIRLVTKERNEGKAMALDDALPLLSGELVLLIDADGRPEPDVLHWMVPHLQRLPQVGAVTGNPRVANTTTLLAKLQAIEFSATVSVPRRAQATWGRLMTFSGICTLLRKSAVESVGRFRPEMATEDIALTWQLERAGYDVRYEPRAIFAMQVPETLPVWWRQRTRWARGLGQVLRRNLTILRRWRTRRLWPVLLEATASTVWSYLFIGGLLLWFPAYLFGVYNFASDPIPNFWGMLIACIGLLQVIVGLALDGRYDRSVRRYVLWAPLYPLFYWGLISCAAVRSTVGGFARKPSGVVTWAIPRYPESAAREQESAS